MSRETLELTLEPVDNQRLANLCGQFNAHLQQIERRLNVDIANRGNQFTITGLVKAVKATEAILQMLFSDAANEEITPEQIHLSMQQANIEDIVQESPQDDELAEVLIKIKRGVLKGRGANQREYLKKIMLHDINFGVGPAGTGKTYLAVACAVEALQSEQVRRIVLVRPAVEAGEKLGFLPGDMAQKVDPYLRPLYDSLYDLFDFEKIQRMIEIGDIEIAPLAFMRGRTLKNSFAILDESQNATDTQIKMFLTRIGENSKIVVNGDPTQIDLPNKNMSGLVRSKELLGHLNEISVVDFDHSDVVRHPLVSKIVKAYSKND